MRILFAHQNFPAQFGAFGMWLGARGWDVHFITAAQDAKAPPGCTLHKMTPHRAPTQGVHRFARATEQAMINGQAFANACVRVRDGGWSPDVVVAHSGWGSGTFAKAVWPDCKLVTYVEWYYKYPPQDAPPGPRREGFEDGCALALARNSPSLMDLAEADDVWCPTRFQADLFPAHLRPRIWVCHDGVAPELLRAKPKVRLRMNGALLPHGAEIVTYATRGMEPHRGFPQFMEALALLHARRPKVHAVIGGEDRVCYGSQLAEGDSWKKRALAANNLDLGRTHFVGSLPKPHFVQLLQATQAHVYLSTPFVLSWSLIEAMAVGAPLVTSDTAPLQEVLAHERSAMMIDHTKPAQIAAAVEALLDNRTRAAALAARARAAAAARFNRDDLWPLREDRLRALLSGQLAHAHVASG